MTTRYEIWIRGCLACGNSMEEAVYDKRAAIQVRKSVEDALDYDCGGKVVIEEKEEK